MSLSSTLIVALLEHKKQKEKIMKSLLIIGSVFAALSVLFGAFGAHG